MRQAILGERKRVAMFIIRLIKEASEPEEIWTSQCNVYTAARSSMGIKMNLRGTICVIFSRLFTNLFQSLEVDF